MRFQPDVLQLFNRNIVIATDSIIREHHHECDIKGIHQLFRKSVKTGGHCKLLFWISSSIYDSMLTNEFRFKIHRCSTADYSWQSPQLSLWVFHYNSYSTYPLSCSHSNCNNANYAHCTIPKLSCHVQHSVAIRWPVMALGQNEICVVLECGQTIRYRLTYMD